MMRKILPLLMALTMAGAFAGGCSAKAVTEPTSTAKIETTASAKEAETTPVAETPAVPADSDTLRIGSLKGPTSMGLVSLMDQSEKKESAGSYEFIMVTAADELLAKMISGELDIALVPANMASILYHKMEQGIRVIDINTLGVLYIVSSDTTIKSVADLKGKTIYLTGKGTSPDYVLNYLLSANGLTSEDVTLEYKSEPAEVAALLKEQPAAIGLLPQPFVTVAMTQNESLSMVLDLTQEWEKIQTDGGGLLTGVTIARADLFEEQEEAVRTFMTEHQASAEYANTHLEEAAQLVADLGIIEKAPVAAKAIPYCSITYVDGEQMKTKLNGYLEVLWDLDPKSIGGKLPDTDFYYIP